MKSSNTVGNSEYAATFRCFLFTLMSFEMQETKYCFGWVSGAVQFKEGKDAILLGGKHSATLT